MFDQVDLVFITKEKNKNREIIEKETRLSVPVESQRVSQTRRDKYHDEGLSNAYRFKVPFLGNIYEEELPFFELNGVRYTIKDITHDTTKTHHYIEGVTAKGAM